MNEPKTEEIDALLKNSNLDDYDKLRKDKLSETLPSLSKYLEDYMLSHNLKREDVVRKSLMAEGYAYQLLNGTKARPTRDRVIAICLAMHMSLEEVNKALRLCSDSILYSKDPRDALIIISFNVGQYDIMKLNEALIRHGMNCLETSKDAKGTGSK